MARIITVLNAKGGTGKTTTAVNLSSYLVALGKYFLLVDLDPQANSTSGLGIRMDEEHAHLYHAMIDSEPVGSMIRKTSMFGFDALPSGASLAGAGVELVNVDNREFRLKTVLNSIRTNYDYILIDYSMVGIIQDKELFDMLKTFEETKLENAAPLYNEDNIRVYKLENN